MFQYSASVPEMVTKEILRMKVTDADQPNTPASRPVFSILQGNEEGNYAITTDPKTNEGVLSVVQVGQTITSRKNLFSESINPARHWCS